MKPQAGRHAVGIPAPLLEALRQHREVREKEREIAAQLWQEGDWVFTQPNGRPIDPHADHVAGKSPLKEAGARDASLHDARHTNATMLLVLGVPTRAVMEVMGMVPNGHDDAVPAPRTGAHRGHRRAGSWTALEAQLR